MRDGDELSEKRSSNFLVFTNLSSFPTLGRSSTYSYKLPSFFELSFTFILSNNYPL
jgi:hypothetical protein